MSLQKIIGGDGPKRILALDGGGIRGMITVEVLKESASSFDWVIDVRPDKFISLHSGTERLGMARVATEGMVKRAQDRGAAFIHPDARELIRQSNGWNRSRPAQFHKRQSTSIQWPCVECSKYFTSTSSTAYEAKTLLKYQVIEILRQVCPPRLYLLFDFTIAQAATCHTPILY